MRALTNGPRVPVFLSEWDGWIVAAAAAASCGLNMAAVIIGPLLVELGREFDVPAARIGFLATSMAIAWAVVSPFAGWLSDRIGRRGLVVWTFVGLATTLFLSALVPSVHALWALRIVGGLFAGSCAPTLMASVSEAVTPERRARALASINLGSHLAVLLGLPFVASVTGLLGWRAAFVGVALLLMGIALAVSAALPLTAPRHRPSAPVTAAADISQRLSLVLAANVLERSVPSMVLLYFPAFLLVTYRVDTIELAPIFVLLAVTAICGNIAGGWLGDRTSRPLLIVSAQVCGGTVAFAVFSIDWSWSVAVALAATFAGGNAAGRPALLALTAEASSRHRGAVLGLLVTANQIGLFLGSAAGAVVIEAGGYGWLAAAAAGFSYLSAVLLRIGVGPAKEREPGGSGTRSAAQ